MDILDELKLAADMADTFGEPGDGNLHIRAIGEIRKLRKLLEPFADIRYPEKTFPDWAGLMSRRNGTHVNYGDINRARAALQSPTEAGPNSPNVCGNCNIPIPENADLCLDCAYPQTITSKATGKKIGCVGHDCDDCRRNRNALQREARAMRTALTRLSDSVLMYLHAMDTTIGPDKTIRRDISEWLGNTCGALELQNDLARQALGVAFSADGKAKALKKLMRSNV